MALLRLSRCTGNLKWLLLGMVICTVVFCEFLADYVRLMHCAWPPLNTTSRSAVAPGDNLRAMLLSDTHLLGPYRGHWLDKLYREWHMHRSFQASVQLFQPDVIFILGDLFDEGEFVNSNEFQEYVTRFHKLFNTPARIPVISAVGNHDVGFHYKMIPQYVERFGNQFNNTAAELYTFKGVHFVLINSMAMEGDGCNFCQEARAQLQSISKKLACLKDPANCRDSQTLARHHTYSHPVVLQHFPTYRPSDSVCREGDAKEISKFRERWEVLSKDSTDELGRLLQPRLAFAGHSHDYCRSVNRWGRPEYTLASYSWRNKVNPSFLLATLTPSLAAVHKCDMLAQQTVIITYYCAVTALSFALLWLLCRKMLRHRKVVRFGFRW